MQRSRIGAVAAGCLLVVIAIWGMGRPGEPARVGAALEAAALPVIDAQLRRGWSGLRPGSSEPPEPGWACTQTVIESQLVGTELRMGITASCHRAPRAAGYGRLPLLVTLTAADLRITDIRQARDGAAYAPSVREMFTPEGAVKVLSGAAR